jgi:zinc protease
VLFGTSGYGLDTLGSETSLASLQTADFREFHSRYALPNNCVLAIFGDVYADQVCQTVEGLFGQWQPGASRKSETSASEVPPPPYTPTSPVLTRITETRDKKQAVLALGFPGTSVRHQDRYPLELIQEACSDLGSRLFLRIRDQLGLAYYVGAQNFLGITPGFFAFYAGTEPGSVPRVEEELLKEAELLRAEGLTEAELARAKAKIIGQRKIARQDLGSLAMGSALDELYGLGFSYADTEDARYQAVSPEDITTAARKYLNPAHAVLAIIHPSAEA